MLRNVFLRSNQKGKKNTKRNRIRHKKDCLTQAKYEQPHRQYETFAVVQHFSKTYLKCNNFSPIFIARQPLGTGSYLK